MPNREVERLWLSLAGRIRAVIVGVCGDVSGTQAEISRLYRGASELGDVLNCPPLAENLKLYLLALCDMVYAHSHYSLPLATDTAKHAEQSAMSLAEHLGGLTGQYSWDMWCSVLLCFTRQVSDMVVVYINADYELYSVMSDEIDAQAVRIAEMMFGARER